MTQETMSLTRFAAIVEAYGAVPRRWPETERAAAEALLARSPEARALLEEAAELDRLLDVAEAPAPSAALREAILEAAPRRSRTLARRGVGWRAAAAALVASLVLGMVVGGAMGDGEPAELAIDVLHLALFDDNRTGY